MPYPGCCDERLERFSLSGTCIEMEWAFGELEIFVLYMSVSAQPCTAPSLKMSVTETTMS